ncbi:MAG: cytochrome-c peroxidase [Bacteroidota bacterium]|jgi:cytochrome c peroxidase
MKKPKVVLLVLLVSTFSMLLINGCRKMDVSPQPITEEELTEPALPETAYNYAKKHGVNSQLATLGRVLFFDKKLSQNNTTSCGSCHKQEFAFADNVQFNRGFDGQFLNRNSTSIQGLFGFKTPIVDTVNGLFPTKDNQEELLLFWDGRQRNMADMVLNPVLNHKEMNIPSFDILIAKLKGINYYPQLFKNAYGTEDITKERIAFAMEGFLACLNTKPKSQSENLNNPVPEPTDVDKHLTDFEKTGKKLFHEKYNCAKCHDPLSQPNLTVNVPSGDYGGGNVPVIINPNGEKVTLMFNIGLDLIPKDLGLGGFTGFAGDKGVFKVPTLQNISVTAPYMHDGRLKTLEEVVDHYGHGINDTRTLAPNFRNLDGSVKKLNISRIERDAIVAFLKTLKNDDFLNNPMYSNPFKK